MLRHYKRVAAAAVLVTSAYGFYASPLSGALKLALVYADPFEISKFHLKGLSAEEYQQKLEQALSENDYGDATAIIEIARENGHEMPAALVEKANASATTRSLSYAYDFLYAFGAGGFDTPAQMAGTITSDLVGIGDARDVYLEGKKWFSTGDPDLITLSLATLGLATTVATLPTIGGAAPVDAGVSVLKTANKTRKLSAGMRRALTGITNDAIDADALKRAFTSAPTDMIRMPAPGALRSLYKAVPSPSMAPSEMAAFRSEAAKLIPIDTAAIAKRFNGVLRPTAAKSLTELAGSTAAIVQKGGMKSSFRALSLADTPKDIGKFGALSSKAGSRTSPILRLLGRSSIALGKAAYKIAAAFLFVLFWLIGGVWTLVTLTASARTLLKKP